MRSFLKNPVFEAFWPYLLLTLAVLIAYSNVYHNEFIFDDQTLIQTNGYVTGKLPLSHIFYTSAAGGAGIINDFYRPMQIFLYAVIYNLFGFSTVAFHALNVGLHIANACLVYALGRKLGFRLLAVFFGTLIWALHPVHTEAVTYISATADTLHVFFGLIVILMILPEAASKRVWQSIPVFILALMSKETAVVVPLLVATCLFVTSEERKNIRLYLRTWPLWAVAVGYVILHYTVFNFQKDDHGFDMLPALHLYATHIVVRIYTFLATLPFYTQMLFDPEGLHFERQFPIYSSFINIDVFTGFIILMLAVGGACLSLASSAWPMAWGLVWFAAAHSLDSGILVPLNMRLLEHWMYLPSIGLCLGGAQAIGNLLDRENIRELQGFTGILALGVACLFGVLTYDQNKIWKDSFTFYPNVLKYGEPSVRSITNLGKAYADRGDYDQAMVLFKQAERSLDTLPETHQNIARIMTLRPGWKQHPEEPIAEMKRALELNHEYLPACDGLAYVYDQIGDEKNAAIYRKRADEIRRTLMP